MFSAYDDMFLEKRIRAESMQTSVTIEILCDVLARVLVVINHKNQIHVNFLIKLKEGSID